MLTYRDFQEVLENEKAKKVKWGKKRQKDMRIEGSGMVLRPIEDTPEDEEALYETLKDWIDADGAYTRKRATDDLDVFVRLNSKVIRPLYDDGPELEDKSRWTETLMVILKGDPNVTIGILVHACKGFDMVILHQNLKKEYRNKGHGKIMNILLQRYGFDYLMVQEAKMAILENSTSARTLATYFSQAEGARKNSKRTDNITIESINTVAMFRQHYQDNPGDAAIQAGVTIYTD